MRMSTVWWPAPRNRLRCARANVPTGAPRIGADTGPEGAIIKMQLRRGGLEWREVDGEIVALDVRVASYLTVNGSGAILWRMLDGGATRDELVKALLDAHGIDEAIAAADTDHFLQSLKDQELLVA